ncbi:MAG: hypothetical protein ABIX28_22230, partial [Vicinamibacterales bacterium]
RPASCAGHARALHEPVDPALHAQWGGREAGCRLQLRQRRGGARQVEAAVDAKVDFLATDQYEQFARARAAQLGRQ